ncbi:hypothetical protein M0812_06561 [Anaeramoeba flamelloides]|uniref:Uncharacterized protein n=1 Tax=Anaeramoeba flamelloides TaxID=1746091 RepID=A0AAV8ABS9_9EUKA|nr:hypothetical protein M0812_06561 [Anaeramoeba flamelloides]
MSLTRLYFYFIFISVCLIPTTFCTTCNTTRITIYDLNGGTCGFNPVKDDVPLFRDGKVLAASQDFYNGRETDLAMEECQTTNFINCGQRCGECVTIRGTNGELTFMVADICDYNTVGQQCANDIVQLDINYVGQTSGEEYWRCVGDSLGMEQATYHIVPCPTDDKNIGFYLPESGSNVWSVAFTPYRYSVGVSKMEKKGAGEGVNEDNEWIELPRTWTNKFVWRSDGTGDQKISTHNGKITNGGDSIILRITSINGETIESNEFKIPDSNPDEARFTFNGQFDSGVQTNECPWNGPSEWIYKENVDFRSGTDSCTWGADNCRAYFEGEVWLTEWWFVHQWGFDNFNPERSSNCYEGSKCLDTGSTTESAGFILGSSASFNANAFSDIEFAVRTSTSENFESLSLCWDDCDCVAVDKTITDEWQVIQAPMSPLACTDSVKNLKFIANKHDGLYFDNIRLIPIDDVDTGAVYQSCTDIDNNGGDDDDDNTTDAGSHFSIVIMLLTTLIFSFLI